MLSIGVITGILVEINPNKLTKLLAYLIALATVLIAWFYSNRLPKTKKGKVGFVISISTGDEVERKKIMEDLVLTLHELIKADNTGRTFQLIKLPEHIAEKIEDAESAEEMRAKCRAHFMIFGRVRLRSFAGKQHHFLDMRGMVVHKPLPNEVHERLTSEFTELLPQRLRIDSENDVLAFAFTSEWINCISRYIIGIAAFCSGHVDYAETLQLDLTRLLEAQDKSFPIYAKLKQRVPWRLVEIHLVRATVHFNRWLKTRNPEDMVEMGRHLDMVPPDCTDDYNVIIYRSILLFVVNHDVKAAMLGLSP